MDLSGLRKAVALHDDEERLHAVSTDFGRVVSKTPRAVATPGSASDVVRIIRQAGRVNCPVSTRGAAHSQSGQSLTGNGILIDMNGLDRIGEIERGTIWVQGGVTWRDLIRHVVARGHMPMVLTSNFDVTVGGTLSIAGLGPSSHLYGAQADNVEELEVVTGDGRLVRCSRAENESLFDGTRCGLGQFSVITGARLRLRKVLPRVRTFFLLHDDLETLMKNQESVISRGRFQHIKSGCLSRVQRSRLPAAGVSSFAEWFYPMRLTVEFDDEPDRDELLAGLNGYQLLGTGDDSIKGFADRMKESQPRFWHRVVTWSLAHPWTCGILPWRSTPACISDILEDVPPDLLARSHVLLVPLRGTLLEAPMLMRPEGELVMAFGILPEVPRATLARVLPVMERVSRRLTDTGGKRYLSGWVDYDHEQWRVHFGERWPQVLKWKELFDPGEILNPGFIRYRRQ